MGSATQLEQYREALDRLLVSPQFSASRQLSDFLTYISQRAFAGAAHLDQTEIAVAVLGRGPDFNPLDDASVRKLASMTRQRLEHYYATQGRDDPVLVTLPVRSYLPQYTDRASAGTGLAPAARPAYRPVWLLAGLGAAVVFTAWWVIQTDSSASEKAPVVIRTGKGDIYGKVFDAQPGSILLGPVVAEADEVTVRLRFTPDHEAQQAGLLMWDDEDNWVRFGRRFYGRSQLEFSSETRGLSPYPPGTFTHEPEAQDGEPVWLSVRRTGNTYRAALSRDGRSWQFVGPVLRPEPPLRNPRAALYAFNGRRDAPSTSAVFERFSVGPTFSNWSEEEAAQFIPAGVLSFSSNCATPVQPFSSGPHLVFRVLGQSALCGNRIGRPVPEDGWTMTTRLDFLPVPGRAAGLYLRGRGEDLRVVRYYLNDPSIAMIHGGHNLVGVPDFGGSPAIYLRMQIRNQVVTGSFSRDGRVFTPLPMEVRFGAGPGDLEAGLGVYSNPVDDSSSESLARFYFLRWDVATLEQATR